MDGDIVAYRNAASCEPNKSGKNEREGLQFAIARADECMRRILHHTNTETYKLFIGGSGNYRKEIDPNYKANRDNTVRPLWLQEVREHLIMQWDAHITDGIEADDALGIEQCSGDNTVICSIDKDLLQIPGQHFNFVKEQWTHISPREGWTNFYTQLIMGDRSDNIPGFDGKMRQTVPKFLQPYVSALSEPSSTERSMYEVVAGIYELGDEALLRNGNLLFIQRREGDRWQIPPVD